VVRTDLTTQREQTNPEQTLTRLVGSPVTPAYADAQYRWYELPLFSGSCQPLTYLGSGWYESEISGLSIHRWGSADNTIWLVNPYDTPIHVTLALTLASYGTARPAALWDGQRLLARWEVQRPVRTYRIGMVIAPGHTRLHLRAPVDYDPQSRREVSIVALRARIADYVAVERR
jgi:hypothetical protein